MLQIFVTSCGDIFPNKDRQICDGDDGDDGDDGRYEQ